MPGQAFAGRHEWLWPAQASLHVTVARMARSPIDEDDALSSDKVDLILSDFGLFLGKKSDRLVVRKGGETLQEVPLFKLE